MRHKFYLLFALSTVFLAAQLPAQEEDAVAPIENNQSTINEPEPKVSKESDEPEESNKSEESEESEEPEEQVEEVEQIDLDNPEDADLDEQSYEDEDDGFVPTQEVPADTPIPFPSNI
jgi:hypothetical protein